MLYNENTADIAENCLAVNARLWSLCREINISLDLQTQYPAQQIYGNLSVGMTDWWRSKARGGKGILPWKQCGFQTYNVFSNCFFKNALSGSLIFKHTQESSPVLEVCVTTRFRFYSTQQLNFFTSRFSYVTSLPSRLFYPRHTKKMIPCRSNVVVKTHWLFIKTVACMSTYLIQIILAWLVRPDKTRGFGAPRANLFPATWPSVP